MAQLWRAVARVTHETIRNDTSAAAAAAELITHRELINLLASPVTERECANSSRRSM